jgi:hypothetical protein
MPYELDGLVDFVTPMEDNATSEMLHLASAVPSMQTDFQGPGGGSGDEIMAFQCLMEGETLYPDTTASMVALPPPPPSMHPDFRGPGGSSGRETINCSSLTQDDDSIETDNAKSDDLVRSFLRLLC